MRQRTYRVIREVVDRAGLGGPARRVRDRVHARRAPSPVELRARRDDEHMRLLLAFLLAPDSNCVDVGAGLGDVLSDIVRIAPMGRHIAYEPLPQSHAVVQQRFPGVDVRRAALSDVDGETTFTHVLDLPAYSGFRRRPYPSEVRTETIAVRTERLDDHLPDGYVPALIKIDVEGAQQLVIEGAMRTIATHRPVVIFEHGMDSAAGYGTTSDGMHHLLCDEAGLRIFDLDGNGPLDRDAFRAARVWNFVAHR
jgi:FkbM family methyltransferase